VPVEGKVPLTFDFAALSQLDFSQPDLTRFPCLRLAYEAAAIGGDACIALNAADELAVAAFLSHQIPFLGIPSTIEQVLSLTPAQHPASIKDVLTADADARGRAQSVIAQQSVARV
jgi:1-deoxy-D-xylulose-5-phosphate reductoisomerase